MPEKALDSSDASGTGPPGRSARLAGILCVCLAVVLGALYWAQEQRARAAALDDAAVIDGATAILPESSGAGAAPAGDAREQVAEVAEPLEATPAPPSWRDCAALPVDEQALRVCAAGAFALQAPVASELGEWICEQGNSKETHGIVVEEALAALPPAEVLVFLDELQRACDVYKSRKFLYSALRAVGERTPGWLAVVANALTPELMFDPRRGVAIVQVSELFARSEGFELAVSLLEEGGRGSFGGTGDQIKRAGLIAALSRPAGAARLDYLTSLLDAPGCPGGARVGNSAMHLLCTSPGGCWPDGDTQRALELAQRLLADPRFAREAAAQLIHGVSAAVPQGCDPEVWRGLHAEAERILAD